MPTYKVIFKAMEEYHVNVEADDEEAAEGADAYGMALDTNPSDHYWYDSEVVEETDEEPDFSV